MWEQLGKYFNSPNSEGFKLKWQVIESMPRNEEKERQAKDTSKVFTLNKGELRVSSERKKKNLFHWKIIDFECWQDFRTEMTFKGQDTALKF